MSDYALEAQKDVNLYHMTVDRFRAHGYSMKSISAELDVAGDEPLEKAVVFMKYMNEQMAKRKKKIKVDNSKQRYANLHAIRSLISTIPSITELSLKNVKDKIAEKLKLTTPKHYKKDWLKSILNVEIQARVTTTVHVIEAESEDDESGFTGQELANGVVHSTGDPIPSVVGSAFDGKAAEA